MKKCTVRTAGNEWSKKISIKYNINFQIGSNICTSHKKQEENDKVNTENTYVSTNSEHDPDLSPS